MNNQQQQICDNYIHLYRQPQTDDIRNQMDELELQMDEQITEHVESILGQFCFG